MPLLQSFLKGILLNPLNLYHAAMSITSLASMLSEESYREDAFMIKELLLTFWIRPGMHFVVWPGIGRNVSCTVGDFT